jgi:hypothetical protein
MKSPLQISPMIDRGGEPSVRDLLSSLVFNPVKGTIHLGKSRIVMQRAALGSALREDLTAAIGAEEAKAFLLRLGFRSGGEDAKFVKANWPHLDLGDAFTAGTRLHTFSGVVSVQTVHNAFDFDKRHFDAEFLWHNSSEAQDFVEKGIQTHEPACWSQVGYASGYASEFFGTLIVYKERSCAAMGDPHCHLVGKTAEAWGDDDPDVALFKQRIRPRASRTHTQRKATTLPTSPVLRPVASRIAAIGTSELAATVLGPRGSSRHDVLVQIAQIRKLKAGLDRRPASAWTAETLNQVLRSGPRSSPGDTLAVIDDIEAADPALTGALLVALSDPRLASRLAVTTTKSARAIRTEAAIPLALWLPFAPGAIELPPLHGHSSGDIKDIVETLVSEQSRRAGVPELDVDDAIVAWVCNRSWPGDLAELRAVITEALLITEARERLPLDDVKAAAETICPSTGTGLGHALTALLEDHIASGTFVLSTLDDLACEIALDQENGNLSAAARRLGLSRAQLAYRVKERGKEPD